MAKYVYLFSEGDASMRNLLGGKGANLAEMTGLGLPVPRGFTVTTEACIRYYRDGKVIAKEIEDQIYECLSKTEQIVGKKFETQKPVSCFSTFRCPCIDAGYDGYHFKSRIE